MNKSKWTFIFTIINLIFTIIFITKLPEDVVFGLTGEFYATQFVGRWSNLIIPIMQVICIGIIFLIDIFHREDYHRYRYIIAWVAVAFTTFLSWTLMFVQYKNFELGVAMNWPWTIIILFPIALFMLAEGMSAYHRVFGDSSVWGFKYIKDNEIIWIKTHRCAGITCFICAITLVTIAILNELIWHTNWIYLVAVLVILIVYYLTTFAYARNCARNYGAM